jgi:asparagine synthase (glutamine-hydrolysing)
MCGISGCLSFDADREDLPSELHGMTSKLAHRGPDDEGYFLWGSQSKKAISCSGSDTDRSLVPPLPAIQEFFGKRQRLGLGHRRFSIIDITSGGHQPFVDPQGRAAIVFNGEIYNYVEVREELEKLGVTFQTESDTEVLLQAYLTWGESMLPRLNGMWGFALFDLRTNRLFLSRDRIGEKQIYYTTVGQRLYFASEIKALLAVPRVWERRKPDDATVYSYLYLGLRNDIEGSFFEGIQLLPAAHCAWVELNGQMTVRRYWDIPRKRWTARELPFKEAQTQLVNLLTDSIKIRVRADVPVAAELSGGMDSPSIVALASRFLQSQGAPHPLRTFSVQFDDPRYDESPLARSVAARSGSEFNAFHLDAIEYWSIARELLLTEEQPHESPGVIGGRAIRREMKRQGIRVVLNGSGGDELLSGYSQLYLPPFIQELLLHGKFATLAREVSAWRPSVHFSAKTLCRHLLSNLRFVRRGLMSRRFAGRDYSHINTPPDDTWEGVLRQHEQLTLGSLSVHLTKGLNLNPMPMYMVDLDKISMEIPVEMRLPFLDPNVIEFATQLPVEYLMRKGWNKAVLRYAMADLLPPEVCWRRAKQGFPVPFDQVMQDGKEQITNLFSEPRSARFVSPRRYLDQLDQLNAKTQWRAQQVELWMRLFDLS